ncbi:hypothetical protein D9758_013160 [Tetrapyrgos nigripes]|uniref:Uncharacterized protein n=1 Tax=Tetrapyrgos nigripes TaxID=182062 RepID=A0A8H5CE63_9AGAR|nr:hypothetical protein D9758_013160 [Tetrapyrgos nigripes]
MASFDRNIPSSRFSTSSTSQRARLGIPRSHIFIGRPPYRISAFTVSPYDFPPASAHQPTATATNTAIVSPDSGEEADWEDADDDEDEDDDNDNNDNVPTIVIHPPQEQAHHADGASPFGAGPSRAQVQVQTQAHAEVRLLRRGQPQTHLQHYLWQYQPQDQHCHGTTPEGASPSAYRDIDDWFGSASDAESSGRSNTTAVGCSPGQRTDEYKETGFQGYYGGVDLGRCG